MFFYGTHGGVELDLYWPQNSMSLGAEFKYMDAPRTTKSMRQALEDLSLDHLWVIYPGDKTNALEKNITVLPLAGMGSIKAFQKKHDGLCRETCKLRNCFKTPAVAERLGF